MEYRELLIILACFGALFIALLVLIRKNMTSPERTSISPSDGREQGAKRIPCILCGAPLARGETLKSHEFKGEKESIVHIFGCPTCSEGTGAGKRCCPVCGKPLPAGDFAIGRMWVRASGKKHLRIIGCTLCKPACKAPHR